VTSATDSVDWRDPWPVVGVAQEPPASTPAVDGLYADGYRAVFTVDSITTDVDQHQAHLNNTAAVRIFSELRIAYVASRLAPDWPRHLRKEKLIVVVRELHVDYQSEAWPHETFIGATRLAFRRGKSVLIEQALVEATTARPVARAWVVQLLVGESGVERWPDFYWDLVTRSEGTPLPELPHARVPWGPVTDSS